MNKGHALYSQVLVGTLDIVYRDTGNCYPCDGDSMTVGIEFDSDAVFVGYDEDGMAEFSGVEGL